MEIRVSSWRYSWRHLYVNTTYTCASPQIMLILGGLPDGFQLHVYRNSLINLPAAWAELLRYEQATPKTLEALQTFIETICEECDIVGVTITKDEGAVQFETTYNYGVSPRENRRRTRTVRNALSTFLQTALD